MSKYLFFVDDSGTKEYAPTGTEYSSSNTQYFVFGGMLIDERLNGQFVERLKAIKKDFFGCDDVEIKSHWLRRPDKRSEKYLSRFSISDERLTAYISTLYAELCGTELQLVAAVVDKKQMVERYSSHAWYAPAVAYEVLMQRVVQEVSIPDTVSVTIDDMTGATPKGNQYKQNLLCHHEQLKKTGSRLRPDISFSSLHGRLRVMNSALSENVQIADIVFYNVFRQFTDYGADWERLPTELPVGVKASLPVYEYLDRISGKFRTDGNGRIQGYGIVKFPMQKRIPWCVENKKAAP